jgi:hypothetical protein
MKVKVFHKRTVSAASSLIFFCLPLFLNDITTVAATGAYFFLLSIEKSLSPIIFIISTVKIFLQTLFVCFFFSLFLLIEIYH